jgi:CRISPR/Cas system-associated endonuclease/helicase Cas3
MSEVFSQNYEDIDNKEGIQEKNIPSFNDVENNIKQNYENNSTIEGAEDLALNQYKELQQLKEQKESTTLQEARELLDKEAMINEAKTMLYEKL